MWKCFAEHPQMVPATCQSCSGKLTMHGIEKDGELTSEDAKCMDQSLREDCGFAHSSLGGTWGPSLVGSLPGNQPAKVEEILHAGQNVARLVRGQALTVEGVENVLRESVGDVGREIGFRKRIAARL